MSERLRNTPEIVIPNMNPVNDEMKRLLDRYLPKRKPLALEDYDWNAIQPDLVNPDLIACLRFVAEVESNPQTPANNLLRAADKDGAIWLKRFIESAWLPEESMHGPVLRESAIRYGAVSEAQIDKEIEEVRKRGFPIGADYNSTKAAIYGWIQEDITQRFYEAMQSGTKDEKGDPLDPILEKVLKDLAKQENFHRFVYFEGAKATLAHNPNAAKEVVKAVAEFTMPGHIMTPDLQPQASLWAKKFNFPFGTFKSDIATGLVQLIGHKGLGRSAIAYLLNNTPWYIRGPLTPFNMLPIPGAYDLLGKKLADMATRQKK